MGLSRRLIRWGLGASLLTALAACAAEQVTEPTEIVVVIDSDLDLGSELDAIHIAASVDGENDQSASAELSESSELPQTLGLVHRGGPLGPLTIVVTGRVDDAVVVERTASLRFVKNQVRTLPMHLSRACTQQSCPQDQTCSESGCVASSIDAASLAPWTGSPPSLITLSRDGGTGSTDPRDATTDAPMDAGRDADAEPPPDAGPVDAATPDASPDGSAQDPDAGAQGDDAGTDAAAEDGGQCTPRTEVCNELDDDCDGVVDNGFDVLTDPVHCGSCNNVCNLARGDVCCRGTCARFCFGSSLTRDP